MIAALTTHKRTKLGLEVKREKAVQLHAQSYAEKTAAESEHWTRAVTVEKKLENRRDEIIEALRLFETMWDNHLGTMFQVEHHIELEPGFRPFRSLPYLAGRK